jgi:hypothetical protein
MPKADLVVLDDNTLDTTTSATYQTAKSIAGSSLQGSTNYIVIVQSCHGCDNVSSSGNRMRVSTDGGTTAAQDSEQRAELRPSSAFFGEQYFYMQKYQTAATPDDVLVEIHSNGTDTVRCRDTHILMINLDELGPDFWAWSEDLTDYNNVTTGTNTSAEVTIGDGIGDWLVFYCTTWNHDTVGHDIELKLRDTAPTNYGDLRFEVEDALETRCYGNVYAFEALAAEETLTLRVAGPDGGTSDCLRSAVFAIRMDAFEDYFIHNDEATSETQIVNVTTTYTVTTATHTTDTSESRDWVFGANARWNVQGDLAKTPSEEISDATLGSLVGDRFSGYGYNGALARPNTTRWTESTSVADGLALDIDYLVYEPFDADPDYGAFECLIFGFSTHYRQPWQEVKLAQRTRTYLRM